MSEKTCRIAAVAVSLFSLILLVSPTAHTATTADVPNANSIVEDNIEYYMQTDKAVYDVRENVQMLYRVTNVGDEDVEFVFTYGGLDNTCNWIVDKDGLRIWDNLDRPGTTVMTHLVLSPSQSYAYTHTWDMTDNDGENISPGNYTVTGVLGYCPPHERYVPVSVSIDIIHEPETYVNPGESIQARIDDPNVIDGDTIIVYPGTYVENINFNGKNITLRSAEPTNLDIVQNTTIEGKVCFRGTEDQTCKLSGFNIDGYIVGFDYNYGLEHTHATISHCLLGHIITPCDPAISACDGTISNCVIEYVGTMCMALIPDIRACHGLIENCTILAWIEILEGGTCTLRNCIIYYSSITVYRGATLNVSYCDVEGGLSGIVGGGIVNWGPGNIDTDPCFVESGFWGVWVEGDYHLLPGSPCIDTGDPNYVSEPNETDLDGRPRVMNGRVDMGAYEHKLPIPANVRIIPRTINLISKGQWIAAFIRLPEEYNVADIDPNSIFLQGDIEPERFWLTEDNQIAIAKFNRENVQAILSIGEVELTITGRLTDGTIFEGADVITVIDKGSGKKSK
jgi:hypothetical protein